MKRQSPSKRDKAEPGVAEHNNGNEPVGIELALTYAADEQSPRGKHIDTLEALHTQLTVMELDAEATVGWTRAQAIYVLDALKAAVADLMNKEIGADAQTVVFVSHPATELLSGLIRALKDLDNGLVDTRLKPAEGLGGALNSAEQHELVNMALEAASIVRDQKRLTWPEADAQVARALNGIGLKYRKRSITAKLLGSWRHYAKRRPRSAVSESVK